MNTSFVDDLARDVHELASVTWDRDVAPHIPNDWSAIHYFPDEYSPCHEIWVRVNCPDNQRKSWLIAMWCCDHWYVKKEFIKNSFLITSNHINKHLHQTHPRHDGCYIHKL